MEGKNYYIMLQGEQSGLKELEHMVSSYENDGLLFVKHFFSPISAYAVVCSDEVVGAFRKSGYKVEEAPKISALEEELMQPS